MKKITGLTEHFDIINGLHGAVVTSCRYETCILVGIKVEFGKANYCFVGREALAPILEWSMKSDPFLIELTGNAFGKDIISN